MGWYTTCVHTTHCPINHCQLSWACTHLISTTTHLPFDCHQLCTSPSYFGPLPTQFHPSQQLLSTFHTIVNFAHMHIHLLSIVIDSVSAQCLWATTIHPPLVFPPLHHQSVVALVMARFSSVRFRRPFRQTANRTAGLVRFGFGLCNIGPVRVRFRFELVRTRNT